MDDGIDPFNWLLLRFLDFKAHIDIQINIFVGIFKKCNQNNSIKFVRLPIDEGIVPLIKFLWSHLF